MNVRWVQGGLIGLAMAVWLAQLVIAMTHPRGDFMLHYEFGRRLRSGEFLYQNGMHSPYPPAWAVPHAPLSLVPPNVAKPVCHLVGAAALIALLWVLHDLSRPVLPLRTGYLFWVVTATLFVTSRFVTRDLDDGGQNLFLLALSWIGIWLCARGRPLGGGAGLGLAVALKCTAGIFVLYFLLKREWKMAAASLAWTGLFFLAPILWLGPAEFRQTSERWLNNVLQGPSQPDPSVGVLGPEPLQNRSLRPSLARYLMHLPPGHPGRHYIDDLPEYDPSRTPHPWSVDFLDLPPATAGLIVKIVMGLGLLAVAWLMRGSPHLDFRSLGDFGSLPSSARNLRTGNGTRLRLLWEAAIISVLALLYSPITWGQHCVAVVPAIYLLIRALAAEKMQARWVLGFLIAFTVLVLCTYRSFIGKHLSLLVESYHLVTFALGALIVALFVCRRQSGQSQGGTACETEHYS